MCVRGKERERGERGGKGVCEVNKGLCVRERERGRGDREERVC